MIVALNKFIIIMTPYGVKKVIAVSIDTLIMYWHRNEQNLLHDEDDYDYLYEIVYSQMSA